MASVYYLLDDALHVPDYIVEKYLHQDKDVKSNYLAAVIVQRSYRGYVARRHYKNIRSAIIKIQKYIRGWLVRYKLPDILQERYDHMCLEHYNKMATKIQACWRGILVRHEMDIKNIINKRELTIDKRKSIKEEYSADTEDNSTNANQDKTNAILNGYSGMPLTNDFYKMKIVDILFDRHHLLSTKKIKGILDNKFILTSKVEQKPYERHLLKQGKYEIQNKNITRDEDKSRNICESDFKLVLKHVIERSNVAPYYADFWYKECFAHNLTEI
ncbi:spermatogenesis-associated protein 17-like isoform X2 [Rhynchophorus ferrugineus]|uniref:spermatogenesis-associated protein 17-like isoform X2 n=1 Tax=Rhynchophorus ferrugineus TaxID=354439 RepID=UPI003FCD76B2